MGLKEKKKKKERNTFIQLLHCLIIFTLILIFQSAMTKFTQKVVQMLKEEKLFESQGGPIILSQVIRSSISSFENLGFHLYQSVSYLFE